MCQDTKETEVSTKDCDVVISQILNFHSIRSLIIAKLKKQSENTNVQIPDRYW